MASVAIRDVRKAFGATHVIHGVDIAIGDGEFVVLVGPSGCGKSTLLRMIAGLENITARRNPHRRPRRQQPAAERARHRHGVPELRALSAHDRRRQHGLLAEAARRAARARSTTRVNRAADILGLTHLLERFPRQLSGGQRQRVAMGRAIVRDPQVFLFDEPLSNLDAKLRVQMRTEIKELHQRLKTTTIYVTHDQIEAMTMADKIVVMHDGLVEQIGAPLELYDRPDNLFVAGFIGSPAMNLLKGTHPRQRQRRVSKARTASRLPLGAAPARQRRPAGDLRRAAGAFRRSPTTAPRPRSRSSSRPARRLQVVAKLGGEDIIAVFRERHQFKPGDKIRLKPDPRLVHLFDEATGQATERD